jgi:hypothetical protein
MERINLNYMYLKIQFVPHCKHTLTMLYKKQSANAV